MQRLQHRIHVIIEGIGKEEQGAAERRLTDGAGPDEIQHPRHGRLGPQLQRRSPMRFLPASDHSSTDMFLAKRSQAGSANPNYSLAREASQEPTHLALSLRRRAALCRLRYNRNFENQKKHREHHRHERRRRPRRTTCSETTEETSATSKERIKSKIRMRRERLVQKYITTTCCEVTLSTAFTFFFRLHFSHTVTHVPFTPFTPHRRSAPIILSHFISRKNFGILLVCASRHRVRDSACPASSGKQYTHFARTQTRKNSRGCGSRACQGVKVFQVFFQCTL